MRHGLSAQSDATRTPSTFLPAESKCYSMVHKRRHDPTNNHHRERASHCGCATSSSLWPLPCPQRRCGCRRRPGQDVRDVWPRPMLLLIDPGGPRRCPGRRCDSQPGPGQIMQRLLPRPCRSPGFSGPVPIPAAQHRSLVDDHRWTGGRSRWFQAGAAMLEGFTITGGHANLTAAAFCRISFARSAQL
jgi:hypothetical protein